MTIPFEFNATLMDDREVSVEGNAHVIIDCDCQVEKHNHITDINYNSVVDKNTDKEIELTEEISEELEQDVYSWLEKQEKEED